jgi:hypothetical protein
VEPLPPHPLALVDVARQHDRVDHVADPVLVQVLLTGVRVARRVVDAVRHPVAVHVAVAGVAKAVAV